MRQRKLIDLRSRVSVGTVSVRPHFAAKQITLDMTFCSIADWTKTELGRDIRPFLVREISPRHPTCLAQFFRRRLASFALIEEGRGSVELSRVCNFFVRRDSLARYLYTVRALRRISIAASVASVSAAPAGCCLKFGDVRCSPTYEQLLSASTNNFFLSAPGALAVSILARNLGEDYAEVSDTRVVREINNIVGRWCAREVQPITPT